MVNIESYEDSTFQAANASDVNLADFMARPVKIYEIQLNVGSLIAAEIFPWSLFFNNKRVINRMANFSHFRSKLCLKLVINGTPFHYGRILASYEPNFQPEPFTIGLGPSLVRRTQLPHVFLDPTEATGGVMKLPFFYPKDGISMFEPSELDAMGILRLDSMADLLHANQGTDPITVSVYAWAEDLELCVPTSLNPTAIVPQAGPMEAPDEYGQGVVSKPASTVAHVAGRLSAAPIIGPYAMATKLAAGAVGRIAALFGFSRPISLQPIQVYKPKFTGDLACTDSPDTCEKLTVDSKQETTIDPRVVGLSDVDEMSIQYIASKESYFTTFAVDNTDAIDDKVFSVQCNPTIFQNQGDLIQPTAIAFAVKPFDRWRGSLKYRFLIDAASTQKARLAFVYRPFQTQANADYETNLEYTYICDIQEKKDFTMDCGWTRNVNWLKNTELVNDNDYLARNSDSQFVLSDIDYSLGNITVHVVNTVTGPSTTASPIFVHCFISAGDDFQVAKPRENPFDNVFYIPQGGPLSIEAGDIGIDPTEDSFEEQAGEIDSPDAKMNSQEGDMEHADVEISMSKAVAHTDRSNLVFFGERITSMRQMLKRYNLHEYVPLTNNRVMKIYRPFIPVVRGESADALHIANNGGLIPYNFVKTTLLNYLLPAYAGFRGSVRYKNIVTDSGNTQSLNMRVIRETEDTQVAETLALATGNPPTDNIQQLAFRVDDADLGYSGMIVVPSDKNPVLEYELPWYSHLRFGNSRNLNWNRANDYNSMHKTELTIRKEEGAPTVEVYVSVGEDFSTYFFTGAPPYQRTAGFGPATDP